MSVGDVKRSEFPAESASAVTGTRVETDGKYLSRTAHPELTHSIVFLVIEQDELRHDPACPDRYAAPPSRPPGGGPIGGAPTGGTPPQLR